MQLLQVSTGTTRKIERGLLILRGSFLAYA